MTADRTRAGDVVLAGNHWLVIVDGITRAAFKTEAAAREFVGSLRVAPSAEPEGQAGKTSKPLGS
jgi:hypothetical protein